MIQIIEFNPLLTIFWKAIMLSASDKPITLNKIYLNRKSIIIRDNVELHLPVSGAEEGAV